MSHFRCNISYLEEWLREKDLQGSNAMETLGPLSQVAWLLQVSKTTDDDAAEIKKRCSELSTVQVETSRYYVYKFVRKLSPTSIIDLYIICTFN